jgi:hypothetical protein
VKRWDKTPWYVFLAMSEEGGPTDSLPGPFGAEPERHGDGPNDSQIGGVANSRLHPIVL